MPSLRLSRVPRLTIVFILVVTSMVLGVSLMDYYEWTSDSIVVLLPIVVLTTLVDRVYTVADEEGIRVALVRLGWTAVVAVGCALIFLREDWGQRILRYPEVHFFTMATVILIGRYKGKSLADRVHGAWLAEPAPQNSKLGI